MPRDNVPHLQRSVCMRIVLAPPLHPKLQNMAEKGKYSVWNNILLIHISRPLQKIQKFSGEMNVIGLGITFLGKDLGKGFELILFQ